MSQLIADARASHAAFAEVADGARSAIAGARGAATGSDAWARGEAALADVRAARGKTTVPLADLDRLLVDATTQGEAGDRIEAARAEVAELVAAEDRVVAELSANLP